MFTGIIEDIGVIEGLDKTNNFVKLKISSSKILENINIGDSIAINGVCLTLENISYKDKESIFNVSVVQETLAKTNLGELLVGSGVWSNDQLNIVGIGSVDLCSFGGAQYSGYVDGNEIEIRVWDSSEDYEHSATAIYSAGNGTWGQILTVISELDAWVYGCIDPEADNYNSDANNDDGTCQYYGCTDSMACNYDYNANVDDGNCEYPDDYYDCDGFCLNDTDGDEVCDELETAGCTDSDAVNYDPDATDDDGTCEYTSTQEIVLEQFVLITF